MREILFRGKRCDSGEWVNGFLLKECNYATCSWNLAIEYKTDRFGKFAYDVAEIATETVGQFTGLTDKNGKKIFEGDVVTGLFLFGLEIKAVVVFQDGAFGLRWYRGDVKEFSAFTSICNVTFEVVGNIHDNSELLQNQ